MEYSTYFIFIISVIHDFFRKILVSIPLTCIFTFFFASIVTISIIKSKIHKRNKKLLLLPPGPTPWPIIGNLPEIMKNKPTFKWIHGIMNELNTNIACIRVGDVHVIPVTSPEIALEVLKDRDSIISSRPITMTSEYFSRGFLSIIAVPYGEQWKKMRKVVASQVLNSKTFHWQLNKRMEEADNLVRYVYNQCINNTSSVVNVRVAASQYSGNVIRKMLFNKRYFGEGSKDGGPGFEETNHVEALFIVLMHIYSFTPSDYIPWLRVLDLEGHEKIVSKAMKTINKYNDVLVDERVQQWRDGKKKEPEDLLDLFLLARDANGEPSLSVEEIKAQCTDLMFAAIDNPSNAVEWALAEMINQPNIIQKAVDEIDMVVGNKRLVQESDIPHLNFLKACLREAFRLHPVAAFNPPHVSNEDTTVAGYFIPKGSHVLISRLGLGRNPDVWEEPLIFKPERHMNDSSGDKVVELTEPELRFQSFSRGRRGCMGVTLGSVMSVVLLARLVQGFKWSVPLNEEKIDLTESKDNLFMATPLHARAEPRLPRELYPTC